MPCIIMAVVHYVLTLAFNYLVGPGFGLIGLLRETGRVMDLTIQFREQETSYLCWFYSRLLLQPCILLENAGRAVGQLIEVREEGTDHLCWLCPR